MHTPQPFIINNHYSSLNNSIVQSTPYHARTYSNSKISPLPVYHQQRIKAPSQKKLTLTCQTNQSSFKILPQKLTIDGQKLLKKRGDYYLCKGKYQSLQISQIKQNNPINRQEELQEIKKYWENKFRELQLTYSENVKIFTNQLKLLHNKLINNTKQIQNKNKHIEQLESQIQSYHLEKKQNLKNHSITHLQTKISDIEIKIDIVTHHLEEIKEQQYQKIEILQNKTLSFFGNKLLNLKSNCQSFLIYGFKVIKEMEQKIYQIQKQKYDKISERTRQSTQSFGSDHNKSQNLNRSIEQCGLSFWDDCFFYPQEHSDDCKLVIQMAKRREQPLSCWIDQHQFLRYSDSNSYIFNRKGDKIRLTKQQVQQLIIMKLLIIC